MRKARLATSSGACCRDYSWQIRKRTLRTVEVLGLWQFDSQANPSSNFSPVMHRNHHTRHHPGKLPHAVLTAECLILVMMNKKADDFLFTYPNGDRVRDFRKPWARITKAAGGPNRFFHDLRRSGVRGIVRSGISQHVAMMISGHETESTFRRHDIGDDKDLVEVARLIQLRHKEQKQAMIRKPSQNDYNWPSFPS